MTISNTCPRVFAFLMVAALFWCVNGLAQPASYSDGVLVVPQGADFEGEEFQYFEQIRLRVEAGGGFTLESAQPRSPVASVDSLSVNIMESLPLQVSVTVTGNKSIPCVDLLTPAVSYADRRFRIALAESDASTVTCIAVLDPFETTIPLDVEGLSAGTYAVTVNGLSSEFALPQDN